MRGCLISLCVAAALGVLSLIAVGAAIAAGGGGNPYGPTFGPEAVTMAEYNQVRSGMSLGQVERIIGGLGEEQSSIDAGDYSLKVYKWSGSFPGSSMIAQFDDDKLTMKVQAAL